MIESSCAYSRANDGAFVHLSCEVLSAGAALGSLRTEGFRLDATTEMYQWQETAETKEDGGNDDRSNDDRGNDDRGNLNRAVTCYSYKKAHTPKQCPRRKPDFCVVTCRNFFFCVSLESAATRMRVSVCVWLLSCLL